MLRNGKDLTAYRGGILGHGSHQAHLPEMPPVVRQIVRLQQTRLQLWLHDVLHLQGRDHEQRRILALLPAFPAYGRAM
jgi:hypothetical protein